MIIKVDTDRKTLTINNISTDAEIEEITFNDRTLKLPIPTIATELAKYRGSMEYEGIVAVIQEWYYGHIERSAWCATTVSYFANQLGILDQLGGKSNNVYDMLLKCQRVSPKQFYPKHDIPNEILKDDILFMMWDKGEMTHNSNKHVCVAEYASKGDTFFGIGGNQKDKICTLKYERDNIYALFRPNYGKVLGF